MAVTDWLIDLEFIKSEGSVRFVIYYKLILKGGHMGTGKYYEHTRYIGAKDTLDAWKIAMNLPRVKGNHGIFEVRPITYNDYVSGKLRELEDPYLQRTG
jgi:hypothetical protein